MNQLDAAARMALSQICDLQDGLSVLSAMAAAEIARADTDDNPAVLDAFHIQWVVSQVSEAARMARVSLHEAGVQTL